MTTVEEWDVKFKSFVDLRNDILCQAKQLQLLVLNLGVIHRVCSIIWETRDKISFEKFHKYTFISFRLFIPNN